MSATLDRTRIDRADAVVFRNWAEDCLSNPSIKNSGPFMFATLIVVSHLATALMDLLPDPPDDIERLIRAEAQRHKAEIHEMALDAMRHVDEILGIPEAF